MAKQNNEFLMEITSPTQLELNHSLKWMRYHLKLIDMDVVMVVVGVVAVVVEGILDTMELMVIILPIKGKL